jgi:hypothetical protein
MEIPTAFKPLTSFIRRAEELEKDTTHPQSKIVAFVCRQYAMEQVSNDASHKDRVASPLRRNRHAMEQGIKLRDGDASPEGTKFLMTLMDQARGFCGVRFYDVKADT